MLLKLTSIMLYSLSSFLIALVIYPGYIALLRKLKIGQQIRDDAMTGEKSPIFSGLHKHKAGTPTMGGGVLLMTMVIMVLLSFIIQFSGVTVFSLVTRQETYIILFAFFSMGLVGLADDILNIIGKKGIKGMTAKMKMLRMSLFAAFISYRFYAKLGVTALNLWPFAGEIEIGILMPILTFFCTLTIVNAINITDGLDGLAGGLLVIIFGVIAVMTFVSQWYIATTLIGVVLGALLAFLRFNINPAKIFLGDSGALALGGLLSSLVYLLNIRFGVMIPFLFLMCIFWVEVGSSFLQICSKKRRKKKLFPVAPFHHLLEHKGYPEATIVMKFRVIQGVLGGVALIMLLYQV